MNSTPTTFERHEIKYLVSDRQRSLLLQAMEARMRPDPHGESTICNVYYDTPDFRLIRRSLEAPTYKEKLRLRSYGPCGDTQAVFLELKKKYRGVVYKRRICLPQSAAVRFLSGQAALPQPSQIGREIAYFLQFYKPLFPAVHLSYDRTAYFSTEDPNLRITLDRNLCWRADALSLAARPGGEQLLAPGQSLMEIKVGAAMPVWLAVLLDRLAVRKVSFSKYGMAYQSMLQANLFKSGGVFCA
ncbi:polyphosphate polymerase domain-containing protein [Oscillibacter sp.]|uniref:polyphosphate polymerase domain-containing protein n=1 Tax=Oscillibacter sp. TaxID=1945593 RepID=UPI00262D26D6|nr:polyphosphate polymerase domain-containing protein [Oscillibacter sp.]MDD3347823.1 polyphosphate polymerase domain-containing protein [Oscillibacter sp.]